MAPTAGTAAGCVGCAVFVGLVLAGVPWVQPRASKAALLAAVAVWFWTSAEWAAATKLLERGLEEAGTALYPSTSLWLTLVPQLVSLACVHVASLLRGIDLGEGTWRPSPDGLGRLTWHAAGAAYFFGQLLTVEALGLGSPGVAFTVKAIEPLTTATLAVPTLGQRWQPRLFMALAVSCSGIVLTVWGSHEIRRHIAVPGSGGSPIVSVAFALLANVGFSSRACIVKKAYAQCRKDPLEAFGRVTTTGTLHGATLLTVWMLMRSSLPVRFGGAQVEGVWQSMLERPGTWAVASSTYFLYQCSSLLILDCMQVESHALLVALKHIFVVVLASVLTGSPLGATSSVGVAVASVGVLWYTVSPELQSKQQEHSVSEKTGLKQRAVPAELPLVLHCAVFVVAALGCASPGLGL